MLLTDVRTIWGRSQLVRSLPVMEEHFDVVFVPFAADAPLEQDRHWGLFTRDGQLIDASAYRRGHHGQKVSGGVFPFLNVAALPEAPLPHYIYGGPIINHFGHFLITSLARFWVLGRDEGHSPILCHSHGTVSDWFGLPYRTQFWAGLPGLASAMTTSPRSTSPPGSGTFPSRATHSRNRTTCTRRSGRCVARSVTASSATRRSPRPTD